MDRYYDLVLGLIPLALLVPGGALVLAGVSLELAVSLSGLVAVGVIGHAIFVNGPVSTGSERSGDATSSQSGHVRSGPLNAD